MNQIGFDPTIKQYWHVGPTFGVVARFTSERYFKAFCALQVELNYASLGWRENVLNANSEPLPDTYRRDQHYLQLPVLARLAWGKETRGFMGYFLAGPQVVVIIRGLPFRRTTCSLRTVTLSAFSAISPMPPQWWMVTSSTRTPDDAVAWMAGECRFWVKTPLNVRIVPTGGRARTNRVWSS